MANEPVAMTATDIIRANLWALRERNRIDSQSSGAGGGRGQPASRTWTQAEVASALGVAERTYGSWERDPRLLSSDNKSGRQSFTVEELIHLARVFGCDVSTLLQPSQALLRSGVVIEVPALSSIREGRLRVSAEDYSLWLSSIQSLPEQDDPTFDRLTSEAHDHGTKGDLRTRRVRPDSRGEDLADALPGGPLATTVKDPPRGGWHESTDSPIDPALSRAELARQALWLARRAIRIARMVPTLDPSEGDSAQQALDDVSSLLDDMGDLLLVIAERGAATDPDDAAP